MVNPYLSVIVPAFNEEARIVRTLEKLLGYLRGRDFTWEVVVADDGSSDRTTDLVRAWASEHGGFRLETLTHGGKGWAVRHGMLAAWGAHRFLCDADLAMPIEQLGKLLIQMEGGYDIVAGSRQVAGARRFDEPALRHVMGRVFNMAVRWLAVRGFEDTQCGFKCFRGEVADDLFGLQRSNGWAFDVEILYLARRRGYSVLEAPIDWYYRSGSKVRPGVDSFLMLRDTLLVRWWDLKGHYGPREAIGVAGSHGLDGSRRTSITAPAHPGSGERIVGKVAVVVPTYNEARNVSDLSERIFALGIPELRLIVVDDDSPDGTADVVRSIAAQRPGRVDLISRQGKQGLGPAYVEGFSHALANGADYVVQMDADLSHSPDVIPALVEALAKADVAVGSRYVRGGGVDERWSVKRRVLSYVANLGIRAVAGLSVRDATSGLKAFRATVLQSLDLDGLRCRGFGFQAEIAKACQRLGYRVVEYPIVFRNRTWGQSKMSLTIMFEAFWLLLLLRFRR